MRAQPEASHHIGGAYVDRGDSNRLTRDFDQWEANAGVGWIEEDWGMAFSGSYTKASDRSNRLFGIGGYYSLTPNIELRTDLVHYRERDFNPPAVTTERGLVGIVEVQFTI